MDDGQWMIFLIKRQNNLYKNGLFRSHIYKRNNFLGSSNFLRTMCFIPCYKMADWS